MSATIDERVVQMKFNNSQFEQGANQTMNTVEKLKKSLDFGDSEKSLDGLNKAASENALGLLGDTAGVVETRLSALNVVAMTVISNITTSVMNAVSKISSSIYSLTVSGGITRALNIEQAKFQLEGLGIAWDSISGDLSYAVNETAYSLDAAAKAASTLAATGIQVGDVAREIESVDSAGIKTTSTIDSMSESLRAISGVASQTGASYESVAQIFSTIAGNGRMMGQQLTQFASYGLNVAADMANALGTTEAQLRDDVSSGLISYEQFVDVMFDKYADHAVKANETLSGITSNIRSAFAKIGAEFFQPIVENNGPLVTLLNNFKTKVDEIKVAMIPMMQWMSDDVIKIIDKVASVLKNVDFSTLNMAEGTATFTNFHTAVSAAQSILNAFVSWVKPAWSGVISVFQNGRLQEVFDNLASGVTNFFNKLTLGEKGADNIQRIFRGLTSVFDIFLKLLNAVGIGFLNLEGITVDAGSGLLDILAKIGDWLYKLDQSIPDVSNSFVTFGSVLDSITSKANPFEVILSTISGAIQLLAKGFQQVIPILKTVWSGIVDVISDIIDAMTSKNLVKVLEGSIIAVILYQLKKIAIQVKQIIGVVKSGLSISGIQAIGDSVRLCLDQVKDSLYAWEENLKANFFIKIAAALGILAVSLTMLSKINLDSLLPSLGAITVLMQELMLSYSKYNSITIPKNSLFNSGVLVTLAASVLILASAVKKIASLDIAGVVKGLSGVSVLLYALVTAINSMPTEKLAKCSTLMLSMSVSVRLLTSSVKALAQLAIADLIKGLTSVIVLLKSLVTITNGITTTKLAAVGLGLMEVATSVRILASSAKVFADMDITQLLKAGTAIGALLVGLSKFNEFNAGSKGLISVGFSMTLISTAFLEFAAFAKIIASISWEGLAKSALSLVAILGSFTALGVALSTLQKTCPNMQSQLVKFGGILVIFGIACQEFAIYTKIIASVSWEGLAKAGIAMVSVLAAFSLMGVALTELNSKFPGMNKELLKFAAVMVAFGAALTLMAPAILMLSTMKLSEAVIAIGSIITLMAAIEVACYAMQAVPWSGIAKASVGMLAFGVVLGVIAGIVSKVVAISDCDGATKVMKAMGELAVEMAIALDALIVAGTFASAALIGIGVMAAAIAALTTLVWAIGALSDGSTVRKFERGVEIMGLVGKAIGEFFGNIVGGFIDGATSTLEDVADRLIYFIDAIKDIMDTVSSIDTSVLKSCKDIVSVINNFGDIKYTALPSVEETNSMKSQLEAIAGLFIAYSDKFQNGVKDFSNLKAIFADTASASESLSSMIKTLGAVTWDLSAMPDEDGIEKLKNKLVSLVGFMTAFYQELTSSTSFKVDLAVTTFGYAKSAIKSMMDCVSSLNNVGWDTIGLPDDPSYIKTKLVGMADMMTGFYTALTSSTSFKADLAVTTFGYAKSAIKSMMDCVSSLNNVGWDTIGLPDDPSYIKTKFVGIAELMVGFYEALTGSTSFKADLASTIFNYAKTSIASMMQCVKSMNNVGWDTIGLPEDPSYIKTKLVGIAELMIDFYSALTSSTSFKADLAVTTFGYAKSAIKSMMDCVGSLNNIGWDTIGLPDDPSYIKTKFVGIAELMVGFYEALTAHAEFELAAAATTFKNAGEAITALIDVIPLTSDLSPTSSYLPDESTSEQILEDLKGVADLMIGYYSYFADAGFVDFSKAKKMFINSADAASGLSSTITSMGYALSNISILPESTVIQQASTSILAATKMLIDTYKLFITNGVTDFSNSVKAFEYLSESAYELTGAISYIGKFCAEAAGLSDAVSINSYWTSLNAFIEGLIDSYNKISQGNLSDTSAMTSMYDGVSDSVIAVFDLSSIIRNSDTSPLNGAIAFMESLKEFLNNLAALGGTVDTQAIVTIGDLMSGIKSSIENAKLDIDKSAIDIGNSIITSVKTALNNANEIGVTLIVKIKAGVNSEKEDLFTLVKNVIKNTVKSAKSEIGEAASGGAAYQVGKYFVEGLAQGISDNKNKAINEAIKLANETLKNTREVFDEHSPSKETYEIGSYFDQGLGNGIEEYKPYVIGAAESLSQSTLDTLHTNFQNGSLSVSEVVGNNYSENVLKYGAIITKTISEMSSDTLASFEENLLAGKTSLTEFLNETYQDVYDDVSSIVEQGFDPFKSFSFDVSTSVSEVFADLQSQIKGMTEWSSMLSDLAARGLSKEIYQKLVEMGTSGYQYVKTFSTMTNDQLAQYNELWMQSLTVKEGAKENLMSGWNLAAQWIQAGFANGIQPEQAKEVMTTYAQSGITAFKAAYGIHSPSTVMAEAGRNTSLGFRNGFRTSWHIDVMSQTELSTKAMIKKVEEILGEDKAYAIGTNFTKGLANGIRDGKSSIVDQAVSVAVSAYKAACNALKIHSPSRKMQEVGMYFDMGFANGIEDYAKTIEKSSKNVGYSALDAMKEAVAQSVDIMDMDGNFDPTIKPILDLSEVQNGTKELAAMMNEQNISASIVNSTASRINRTASEVSRSGLTSKPSSTVNNITFNQTNNSPKSLDRYQIYRQTRNQLAMMKGVMQ